MDQSLKEKMFQIQTKYFTHELSLRMDWLTAGVIRNHIGINFLLHGGYGLL